MKLRSLDIQNIRGIRSVPITPESETFAIWGPNGSGKSAVVDAIDFLLTGRISRLEGKGTGGISLKTHGPHIDSIPQDALVNAIIQVEGHDKGIEISRCMENPNKLQCDDNVKPILDPIVEIAQRGQHVLSRRDILKFITADSSSRAEGIQELLNISEIEVIRKSLVNARNDGKKELKDAKAVLDTAKAAVSATVQLEQYIEEETLIFANNQRSVLGAKGIDKINSSILKTDLTLPKTAEGTQTINVTVFKRDITNLVQINDDAHKKSILDHYSKLRSAIKNIQSDPLLSKTLSRMRLIKIGKSLLDETGDCPLCETEWSPGVLEKQLEARLEKATKASGYSTQINSHSSSIKSTALIAIQSIEKVIAAVKAIQTLHTFPKLAMWKSNIDKLNKALDSAANSFADIKFGDKELETLLAPEGIFEELPRILSLINKSFPEISPEQTAWDSLTRLEENLKALEIAQGSYDKALVYKSRAEVLHDVFMASRDKILTALYEIIRDRFVELYRFLHGPDEEDFEASIHPSGAGLALEVGFYGRGAHPPNAFHSEGHQDSMGLCLYLALSEHLLGDDITMTILDDVIMSVDAGHRRRVCSLLKKFFPSKQFLITTHDKNWAYQMRTEGLVTSKNSIEFYKWNIESGPYVNYEADLWSRIASFVDDGDVANAAILLRKGSEQFLSHVCDSIEANVKYRLDARNDLGDFLPAAVGKLKKLLGKAKSAAHSWSRKEEFAAIGEFETVVGQVVSRTQSESWAVNAAIHFNNWEALVPEDFRPVRDAIHDLHLLFICSDCGSILRVSKEGLTATNLRCQCAKINWNLISKDKS